MPTISDFLFGDWAEAKEREIIAEQSSQISEKVGQQGQAPVADQGIGPRRGVPSTGIFNLPERDQAIAQARIIAETPAFAQEGMGFLQQALQQRGQIVQAETQFIRQQQRISEQFKTTNTRLGNEWAAEQGLRTAERHEKAALHVEQLLLADQKFDLAEKGEARAVQSAARAELIAERIEPGEMQNIIGEANQLQKMQQNIQNYKKGYAWNNISTNLAQMDRGQLARKKDKTEFDMSRLEFWRDVDSYQVFLLKEISGGAVTPEEYDRLTGLLPTAQMDDVEIDRNMRILHRELNNKLQLRARAAVFGGRQDPSAIFAPSQGLPAQQSLGAEPVVEPQTFELEMPEGGRRVRNTRRGARS